MSKLKGPVLEDNERFALMKFRRAVSDILKPEYDDHFLLRFLRARQWNAENAEKMLRESLKWRDKWELDTIESWAGPEFLVKYFPHGTTGYDKEGSPIIIIPYGGIDIWGILHSASKHDIVKRTIKLLEGFMKIAYDKSLTHGAEARKFVVIFDMEGFSMRQYAYRPAAELAISVFQMYSNNYPEILKCCYVINAPKIFSFAFNIVRKFLDEYTISKIQIYNSNRKKWLPEVLKRVEADQLPAHYGGNLTDKDGNPKCHELICWGGKIPKEFYISEESTFNGTTTYQELTVGMGSKVRLSFTVDESDVFLKWDFLVHSHDIRFYVKGENLKTSEKFLVVEKKKVASTDEKEIGFVTCEPNHKYTVVFDNSFSYFKSKKLTYSVVMTTPLGKIEQTANSIESDEKHVDQNENDLTKYANPIVSHCTNVEIAHQESE